MITILGAGVLALLITLIGTKFFIVFLVHRGYGQFIRDDGPTSHRKKRGTPTMGGLVVIAATVLAYFLSHLITNTRITVSGVLVLGVLVATGFLGFLDDWRKISKQRSLGLKPRGKLIGQLSPPPRAMSVRTRPASTSPSCMTSTGSGCPWCWPSCG